MNGPDDVYVERKGRIERAPDGLFEGEEAVLHLTRYREARNRNGTAPSAWTLVANPKHKRSSQAIWAPKIDS